MLQQCFLAFAALSDKLNASFGQRSKANHRRACVEVGANDLQLVDLGNLNDVTVSQVEQQADEPDRQHTGQRGQQPNASRRRLNCRLQPGELKLDVRCSCRLCG